tara:strand:+ start:684 stop:851 length:168 start_codon:yes stop_codon:yes gene_type:complete
VILIIGYVYLRMVKLVSCEVIDKRLVEERISRDGIVFVPAFEISQAQMIQDSKKR